QVLQNRLPEGDAGRGYAAEINRAGERAAALARQLLTFARRQPTQAQVFDPARVLGDIRKLLERTIGENIALTVRADAGLGRVGMDPLQFEQVVLNLAINARDAMPQGGSLRIEATNVYLDKAHVARHADARPG